MSQSNSHSESSSNSSNTVPFSQEHTSNDEHCEVADLTLFGSPAPTLIRSGTVKRIPTANFKKMRQLSETREAEENEINLNNRSRRQERIFSRMRSLDSSFRHSLESISEHKTKRSFSPTLTITNKDFTSSLESVTSDQTDYAIRSTSETREERTIPSPGSSYLTWMESVNSGYLNSSAPPLVTEMTDIDSKVGEWNNFWLNYNSARNKYLATPYMSMENKDDDASEVKSTCSTQKELVDKISGDCISLTLDEIHEAMRYSQRITEILQNALARNDQDCANSNNESSYYSENLSPHNLYVKEESREAREEMKRVAHERSSSYIISTQELIRQKEMLKPTTQSSSTSCIKELLNTGVADILKRVINKRRDVITPDDHSSMTRHSFSEWSSK